MKRQRQRERARKLIEWIKASEIFFYSVSVTCSIAIKYLKKVFFFVYFIDVYFCGVDVIIVISTCFFFLHRFKRRILIECWNLCSLSLVRDKRISFNTFIWTSMTKHLTFLCLLFFLSLLLYFSFHLFNPWWMLSRKEISVFYFLLILNIIQVAAFIECNDYMVQVKWQEHSRCLQSFHLHV